MVQTSPAPAESPGGLKAALRKFAASLPAKLLLLTAVFVIVAEVFIIVPSVADFRRNWLMQRVVAAKIASLALEASGGAQLPERLRQELLTTAGVHAVSVKRPGMSPLVLGMPDGMQIAAVYDLRSGGIFALMLDGVKALVASPGRLIRVIASPEMMPGGGEIDAIIDETPLRAALWRHAGSIFWLTLLISVLSAALVYLALVWLLLRPVMRITRNMVSYRENPEDTARIITPSSRGDEIGIAEKELATLQTQLTDFLREKARLANVGLAVSKINHDLRNMLAGAQLVSDRLASVADPTVQRFVPRLIRALDRAITLCSNTVSYGRSEEPPPKRASFALRPLIAEVNESLGGEELNGVKISVSVPAGLELFADRDQIFRVLFNLIRNSLEAFREAEEPPEQPAIDITALREGNTAYLRVSDNGPGIPPLIRANLFKAFQAGASATGAGLGLAISAELVRAHGGDIFLDDTVSGAAFVLKLPAVAHISPPSISDADVFDGKLAQDGISR
jgi:signal transduction histidine kinase